VVPGYAQEQISPDFQTSVSMELKADGTLNNDAASTWTYTAPWLEIKQSNGQTENLYVERGHDWENKKPCLVFTGLNNAGTAIWGKKIKI
jgi:arabinan endo-1,5-alpha-L-arabinosidase